MSALHRLKVYFGMVPAEEFEAAGLGAVEPDGYQHAGRDFRDLAYDSGAYDPGVYDPGSGRVRATTSAERHHSSEREIPRRPAVPHYSSPHHLTETPIRGSLAMDLVDMDTAAPIAGSDAPRIGGRPAPRQSSAAQPSTTQPSAAQLFPPAPRTDSLTHDEAHPLARIVTLHPHSYNEARPIGERYREGNPVIMNLTAMEDRDAKRLVDFAAGLAFAMRGSIDKVTNKVFLLSPPDIEVSAEDRRRIAEGRLFR